MYTLLQNDLLKVLYIITIVFMVVLVIQQRGDPMKTIAWLLVVTFIPLLGIVLYFYFGKNYRKEKIFSRKELADSEQIKRLAQYQPGDKPDTSFWSDELVAGKAHIMKMLYNSDKALLTERNRVKILVNGKVAFERIIAELNKAEKHIHLEYYIIDDDRIGNEVRRILIRKAQEGLEVRVIFDDIGCWSLSD
jgi:cardiolipin synthase